MNFDKKVKRIDKKNWTLIRSEWLNYIPILQAGIAPSIQICELLDLQLELNKVSENGEYKSKIIGLRESIFHEGLFLCHKANSVAKAAYTCYSSGSYTWSLSISYQSAFFAAKSLLCLLGISLPKHNNKYFIVDSFPYPEYQSNKEKKLGLRPEMLIKMIKLNNFQHYHVWRIIQRVLGTGVFNLIEKKIIDNIINLSEMEFAKQRNELHYKNNHWLLNDMFVKLNIKDFAIEKSFINTNIFHPDKRNDFSIILMFLLLKLNNILLSDIKKLTSLIDEDYFLMTNALEKIPEFMEFDLGKISESI